MLRLTIALSAAILLSGCASDSSKLTVALDRYGYQLRELYLLEDVVREAAASRLHRASIGTENSAVAVTVWNVKKDSAVVDVVKKVASEHKMSIELSPAVAFWVRLSATGAATPSAKRLEESGRLESGLEGYIKSLRPELPGVTITQDGDTATVQATDPDFGKALAKAVNHLFLITQLTSNSWRVSWNTQLLSQTFSTEKQKEAMGKTAEYVRAILGDPLGLQVYRGSDPDGVNTDTSSGVHFLVVDPARHEAFINSVRKAFDQNPLFIFSEVSASEARFIGSEPRRQSSEEADFELMGAVSNAIAPQSKLRIAGDGINVEAENQAQNGELSSIVREALMGRNDLVLKPLPDAGLRVELKREAHLGAAIPKVSAGDFLKSMMVRIDAAGVHPEQVLSVDSERARIIFKTPADADKFRAAISRPSGLTISLVDEQPKGTTKSTPPEDDTKLKLPTGEDIWVNPEPVVTGDMVADATATEDKFTKQPVVQFRLTDEGRSRFAAATRLHVGKRIAIIVDGTVIEAPIILDPITGGAVKITGKFTTESANALVKLILPYRDDLLLTVE
jgi:hypothetical protein